MLNRFRRAIIAFVVVPEMKAASRRGRNQFRIALGIGTIAAAGFCASKIIEASPPTLLVNLWTFGLAALIMVRFAAWCFLTIEGGRE